MDSQPPTERVQCSLELWPLLPRCRTEAEQVVVNRAQGQKVDSWTLTLMQGVFP